MKSSAVVVCTWGADRHGKPPAGSEEMLTLARRLAGSLAADLGWLVLGPLPSGTEDAARRHAVSTIHHIADPRLESFAPDAYVEALAQYCAEHAPRVLLLIQEFDTRLVAPRLAGRSGAGVVMNVVDLTVDADGGLSVTASAYGGDTRVVYALTGAPWYVVSVTATAIEPQAGDVAPAAPAVIDVPVELAGVEERVRVVDRAQTQGPRVEDADIIVAGGRGLGAVENYRLVEELAHALGGMAAGTRPIVDDGWVDPSRQIGLTGKITRPVLYVAAGISGASQHMVGCAAAKTIVAINTDREAAIFRYARYGIVGDCLEVLAEITRAVRA